MASSTVTTALESIWPLPCDFTARSISRDALTVGNETPYFSPSRMAPVRSLSILLVEKCGGKKFCAIMRGPRVAMALVDAIPSLVNEMNCTKVALCLEAHDAWLLPLLYAAGFEQHGSEMTQILSRKMDC